MTNEAAAAPAPLERREGVTTPGEPAKEPSATTVVLVRHGVTAETGPLLSGRRPGIHLSDAGREQAAQVAERLSPLPLAALHSSPVERCLETAEAISGCAGLPVSPDEGLLEADYGEWAGRRIDELVKTELWRQVQAAPSTVRFPGGESLREMQDRIVSALEALARAYPGKLVVAVTHADPIKAAVAHFAGTHLDLFQRLFVAPASATVLRLGGVIPVVVKLNDLGGLDDLRPKEASEQSAEKAGPEQARPQDGSTAPADGRSG